MNDNEGLSCPAPEQISLPGSSEPKTEVSPPPTEEEMNYLMRLNRLENRLHRRKIHNGNLGRRQHLLFRINSLRAKLKMPMAVLEDF